MNIHLVRRRSRSSLLLAAVALVFVTPAVARPPAPNSYVVHNLVSDGSIPADHTDPNLVNAWGMSRSATSPWWVADDGTDPSPLYHGSGNPPPPGVSVR